MATKKKATKKTGKAQAKQVGVVGQFYGNQAAPQMPPVVPIHKALEAFDAALQKVCAIRSGVLGTGGQDFEVVANRARRLADAANLLTQESWTLQRSAYAEADK